MSRWLYYLDSTWEHLRSQKVMNLISVIVISVSLMFPISLFWLYGNVRDLFWSVRSNIQMMVYLEDRADLEAIRAVEARILSERGVGSVRHTTKEEAREEFRKSGFGAEFVDRLGKNPFPASFAVSLRAELQEDERYVKELANRWTKLKGVEEVRYGSDWLSSLNTLLKNLRSLGVIMGIMLGATVVILIAATIRLNYYSRQEEMEILRLIGASRSFIRMPYLLEGSILGGVSAVTASAVLGGIYYYLAFHFIPVEGWFGLPFQLKYLSSMHLGIFVFFGVFLGFWGSMISLGFTDREHV